MSKKNVTQMKPKKPEMSIAQKELIQKDIDEKRDILNRMMESGKKNFLDDISNVSEAMLTAEGIRSVLNMDIFKKLTFYQAASMAEDMSSLLDTWYDEASDFGPYHLGDACDGWYDHSFVDNIVDMKNEENGYYLFVKELLKLDLCRRFGKQGYDIASSLTKLKNEITELEAQLKDDEEE